MPAVRPGPLFCADLGLLWGGYQGAERMKEEMSLDKVVQGHPPAPQTPLPSQFREKVFPRRAGSKDTGPGQGLWLVNSKAGHRGASAGGSRS